MQMENKSMIKTKQQTAKSQSKTDLKRKQNYHKEIEESQ